MRILEISRAIARQRLIGQLRFDIYLFVAACRYASAARSKRGSSAYKPKALLQLRQSSPRTRPVTWQ
jgi:hypothetical protein